MFMCATAKDIYDNQLPKGLNVLHVTPCERVVLFITVILTATILALW